MIRLGQVTGVRENPFSHLAFNSRRGQKPTPGLHFHHEDETSLAKGGGISNVSPKVQKHIEALKDKVQKHKDENVRYYAVSALGKIGKEAVPVLIEALKDGNKYVRRNAAVALGKIGKEASLAVPALTEALKDKDENVRYYAVLALGEIGKEAVPALIEALKDKDDNVRRNAAVALGETGKEASPRF